ncbi:hypothetical protein [Baia soyae]|uniref:Uncharacterized protein n=1 Tax=Baia soyae TaxID=1544746 RepID=A0A4R2RJ35_9BACL|nr:hypothetical protein [Baia soyae]TCP63832.1 hypothetical protein EDD57_1465 [Baia soyae]
MIAIHVSLPTDVIGTANPLIDTVIANLVIIAGAVGSRPLVVIIVIAMEIANLPTVAVEIAMNPLPAVQKIHAMIANTQRLSHRGPFPLF